MRKHRHKTGAFLILGYWDFNDSIPYRYEPTHLPR